jgi:hypothetical protein
MCEKEADVAGNASHGPMLAQDSDEPFEEGCAGQQPSSADSLSFFAEFVLWGEISAANAIRPPTGKKDEPAKAFDVSW